MTDSAISELAPVRGKARIDVLDMLRGVAILGIFFMNIPYMGTRLADLFTDVRRIGWSAADAASWTAVQLLLEGTQRGLLELLFGAGLMVLAARAMTPDGPVAVADLHIRRNLWLLGFGLFDAFVLLWPGDILHIYALAALFLFPFRKLGPRLLLVLGLGFALFTLVSGTIRYQERVALMQRVEAAQAKQAAHAPLGAEEKKDLEKWRKLLDRKAGQSEEMKELRAAEEKGHSGSLYAYGAYNWGVFVVIAGESLLQNVSEAFCVMLIGIALWKWRVIQGGRSAGFYGVLTLACYVPGIALRWASAQEHLATVPMANSYWATEELARIAVAVGHVALINLVVKAAAGRRLLAPFRAAGRMAFSLYFLQQIVGIYLLFAPWGPGLWTKLSWTGLYGVAIAVIVGELVLANLWLRFFAAGPLEWLWRSLAYVRWQPFRRQEKPSPACAGEGQAG